MIPSCSGPAMAFGHASLRYAPAGARPCARRSPDGVGSGACQAKPRLRRVSLGRGPGVGVSVEGQRPWLALPPAPASPSPPAGPGYPLVTIRELPFVTPWVTLCLVLANSVVPRVLSSSSPVRLCRCRPPLSLRPCLSAGGRRAGLAARLRSSRLVAVGPSPLGSVLLGPAPVPSLVRRMKGSHMQAKVEWLVNRIRSWDRNWEGFPPMGCLLLNDFTKAGLGDEEEFDRVMDAAMSAGLVRFTQSSAA